MLITARQLQPFFEHEGAFTRPDWNAISVFIEKEISAQDRASRGDASDLSYSLAEILVHLIAQDYGNWLDFLGRAPSNDAGQTAALLHRSSARLIRDKWQGVALIMISALEFRMRLLKVPRFVRTPSDASLAQW